MEKLGLQLTKVQGGFIPGAPPRDGAERAEDATLDLL